jgi:hypothetical protein
VYDAGSGKVGVLVHRVSSEAMSWAKWWPGVRERCQRHAGDVARDVARDGGVSSGP